jgi:hypothetical protein
MARRNIMYTASNQIVSKYDRSTAYVAMMKGTARIVVNVELLAAYCCC